jgi:hypothetical protein
MTTSGRRESTRETVTALDTLLESATAMVDDLAADGLFDRLQRVFSRMPPADRETILQVLEREVECRCFTRGTGDLATGYETRPNPNARLYLRIVSDERPPPLMDHDELVVANYRGLRVLRFVLGPLHGVWSDAMSIAAAMLEPEEREAVRQVLSETLAFVEADPDPEPGTQ